MISNKVKEQARKFALKNAMDYGKADVGAVLSKVIASNPRLKPEIKALAEMVKETVSEVNRASRSTVEKEFESYAKEFEKKEREKAEKSAKPKMELEGAAAGKFATRFAPEPNGYMQLGHAKISWLGREFAYIYRGVLALYFDDTNPEKEKQEYVDAFKKDLEWLGIRYDREYYSSDHMKALYGYAEKLINDANAYVCLCDPEKMKNLRFDGKECEHRKHGKAQDLELWRGMLKGKMKDNEAVLRLKLDMASLNTAMRDPVVFRIIEHEHYRQGGKYRVWPTYDFNTPIIDSLEGMTDPIRSKEYELRDVLYAKVLDLLHLRKPNMHSIARLEIIDNITSKRKINAMITEGLLEGYDDPRLITIAALRRRGIQPQAIKSFVLRFGMSKTNSEVSMDMLLAENRTVIDGMAKRLFLVEEPVEMRVSGIPKEYRKARLRLHPSKELGYRTCKTSDRFLISGGDAKGLRSGSVFRLKDLFNVRVEKKDAKGVSAKFIGNEGIDAQKVQWVNAERNVKCKLIHIAPLLKDGAFNKQSMSSTYAHAEEYVNELEQEEIVQFERVGFFKLDSRKEKSFIGL